MELTTFSVRGGEIVEHICRKRKNEKNVDDHGFTRKKIENKIKSKKNGLLKKVCFCQIKRQIVLLFYPACLNQERKDDNTLMFRKNPYVSQLTPYSFTSLLSQNISTFNLSQVITLKVLQVCE